MCISDGEMVWESVDELCWSGVYVEIGAPKLSTNSPLDGPAISSPEKCPKSMGSKKELLPGGDLVSNGDDNELSPEGLPCMSLSKRAMSECRGRLPVLSEKRGTGGRERSGRTVVDGGAECA